MDTEKLPSLYGYFGSHILNICKACKGKQNGIYCQTALLELHTNAYEYPAYLLLPVCGLQANMLYILLMVICLLAGIWLQVLPNLLNWALKKPSDGHVNQPCAFTRSDPTRPGGKALAILQAPPPPLLI